MNRVLSRASKLSKIIGKANFFTKVNRPLNLLAMQASSRLINTSQMNFAENDRRFEKFSDSSAGSIRQGKHNIRTNLASERINVILEFIENNAQAFNDGDYFDSMYTLAQKLEMENNKINMRRQGFKLVNDYVVNNFQKNSNSMSNTYLMYLSALASKDIKLLNREQMQNFVQKNLAYLEKNHTNMALFPLLNTLSMIGLLQNTNPIQLIKGREGELSGLSLGQIMRVARRLAVPNQAGFARAILSKFIVNELMNKAQNEKILQKARILNLLCRLDSLDPLLNMSPKIRSLIKMITSEMDQLDNVAILPIVDAMIYWDDYSKNEFLREINDLVSSTITHSPDSIYPDFFVRYLESFSKIKSDFGLTADHLRLFLDFYLKNKRPEEIRNPKNLICFFILMRKCRLFEKEFIEQLFDITISQIPYLQIDENLIAYKNIVSNHLGEDHLQKLKEVVKADVTKSSSDPEKQTKVPMMLNGLAKLCFFDCDKELIEDVYGKVISGLTAADSRSIPRTLETYVNSIQDYLKVQYRDGIVAELLNKIDPKVETQFHAKLYIYINESLVSRENEELKKKIQSYSAALSEHAQFKNGFIRVFENLTNQNEGNTPITNLSFSRYVALLRESIKDEAFIVNKEKSIILNILQTTYNMIKQNKMDSKISDDLLNSFLRVGNDIVTKYPQTLISLNIQKIANFLKVFSTEDLDSPLLEKLSIATLESITNEKLGKDLNNDMIVILDKLSKGEKTTHKTELIKRILVSEDRLKGLLENSGLSTQIYKLLTQLNKIDTQIVSDDLINFGKDLLSRKLKDENVSSMGKLNVIYALSNAKNTLFSESELKELGQDIQTIFSEFSAKRLIKNLNSAPSNINRGTLSRLIHMKYANLYEKDETPQKQLALRTLDRFTSIKWPFISIYNKFISDYGSLFDKFSSIEHVNVINYFSRMNIAREDIVNTACNAINMQHLGENEKLLLFKSLIRLGFYKTETGKNPIVEGLLNGIDYSYVLRKQGIIAKIQLLFSGWKLSQNGYETKGFIDSIFDNLSKVNLERAFEAKRRFSFDIINYFLLNSPIAENLDENTKKYLSALFQQRKSFVGGRYSAKILTNYLTVMNHTFEEFPESSLVDLYIPDGKIGILYIDNTCVNIFDKKPIDDYAFAVEELKKKGINAILVNVGELTKNFREANKDHEAFIESIEKNYNIPNKNVEKKYDFTALENNLNMKVVEQADEE